MVMEWASRSGLGHLAEKFFAKLNSAVSVVAMPPQQLTQVKRTFIKLSHSKFVVQYFNYLRAFWDFVHLMP